MNDLPERIGTEQGLPKLNCNRPIFTPHLTSFETRESANISTASHDMMHI